MRAADSQQFPPARSDSAPKGQTRWERLIPGIGPPSRALVRATWAQAAVATLGIRPGAERCRSGGRGPGSVSAGSHWKYSRAHTLVPPGPAVDSDLLGDVNGGGETAAART